MKISNSNVNGVTLSGRVHFFGVTLYMYIQVQTEGEREQCERNQKESSSRRIYAFAEKFRIPLITDIVRFKTEGSK